MLISALCDYYDILASQNKVVPDGFSEIHVNHIISLKEDGSIDSIIDCLDEVEDGGKVKKEPRSELIIKRNEVSTICSNYIEHRGLYIFGLNYDSANKTFSANDERDTAKKKHEAFVKKNLDFIQDLNSPIVNAFRNFLEKWEPEKEAENRLLLSVGKDIDKSNFVFCLSGYPETLLHKDQSIISKWENIYYQSKDQNGNESIRQCGITGENLKIARLHNKINGVRDGQASGTVLISYKNDSESSYGQLQSFNSNISEVAMEKYTEALNYLISSKHNSRYIDGTTVIYWSQNGNEESDDLMSMLTFGSERDNEIDDEILNSLVNDVCNGNISLEKIEKLGQLDVDTDFYFVGIKPNASRLALKFIYRKKLGHFMNNVVQHQKDMRIIGIEKTVPLWKLKKELVSQKSKNEEVNPALITKIFEAMLNGIPYPVELLQKIIQRVKLDTANKISPIRAGIIKAYINRNNRFNNKEDEISMSLDKDNLNQAYLCGRLFAILEQIQQKASNYSLNRTIKDSYFSSATARPSSVFPKIIKLSNYHLSKLGNPKYFTDEIAEITDKLNNEFPTTLSLIEQGKFIIGYYHQMNNKNNNKSEDK